MSELKAAARLLSKAVFPNTCKICGEVIELDAELCEKCKGLKKVASPRCFNCGRAKADCDCKQKKNEYKRAVAPYYYEGSVVTAVYNFKMRKMEFLGESHAEFMSACIKENYDDIAFDFVTFVPFRYFHKIMRGFNQAEVLARFVAKNLDLEVKPVLYKKRYTGVQHKKSATKRKADLFGAFDVREDFADAVEGKTILLIDDIKTTGATLNECAKILKLYGAKEVDVCTFAITLPNTKK